MEDEDLNICGLLVISLVPKCFAEPFAVAFGSTSRTLHY